MQSFSAVCAIGYRSLAAPALLILVAVTASCSASTGSPAPEPASPRTAAACPSQDFPTFLTSFANDTGVQEAFTRRPLQMDSIDVAADPEPRRITRMLEGADLRFPLMPGLQRQAQQGVKMRWTPIGNDRVEVLLTQDDTDYKTTFFFIRNDCWMLYWIKDDSL